MPVAPRIIPQSSPALEQLAEEFRRNIHMPDPTALYVTIAALIANKLEGNPVWLLLVGPASCGKTTLLESLSEIEGIHCVSSVSHAGLLSASSKKDMTKDTTGGLLKQIGRFGILVFKDWTSLLSLPREALAQVTAAFREMYDGKYTRHAGADGGKLIQWSGKLGLLAASTAAVDRHHVLIGDMGERFLYWRFPETGGYAEAEKALRRKCLTDVKARTHEFVNQLDLRRDVKLTQPQRHRLISLATVAARTRSTVYRNPVTRDVEDVPQLEVPTRIVLAMSQLWKALHLMGVEHSECWRILGKVACDCMPVIRRRLVLSLASGNEKTVDEMTIEARCSRSLGNRALDDLRSLGVLERSNVDRKDYWRFADWTCREWKAAFPNGLVEVLREHRV